MLKNIVTGQMYVGSSRDVKIRWKNHRTELRGDRHHSHRLQENWNRHGEDSFVFGVIERCDEDELVEREQYWMDHYESYTKGTGLNVASNAFSPMLGKRHTQKALELISQSSR